MKLAALCLAFAPCAWDGLQDAITRVAAHDMAGAWSAATGEPDPLKQSQAQVYVRHHAGDLEGALAEAVRGSSAHPEDSWLAERSVYIALSLGRAATAEAGLQRLEAALQRTGTPDRASFVAALAEARPAVAELQYAARERDAADRRARWTVFALGASSLALLIWLARRT